MSNPTNSGAAQYCHNCGAMLPQSASFCPRCGTPVSAQGTGAPPPYYDKPSYKEWRRQQRRSEKSEKNEKGEKGEKAEKGGSGALFGAIIGGAILIWLGVSFYLQEIGYLAAFNWWALFIAGIGVILILQGIFMFARNRRPIIGPLIGGGILLIIGLAFFFNSFVNLWPLILVVIGLAIVASAFGARRRTPPPA